MSNLEAEFRDRGVKRGSALLLRAEDAQALVRRARLEGVCVLQINGSYLRQNASQLGVICNAAPAQPAAGRTDCWSIAQMFLARYANEPVLFEVVLDSAGV